MAEMVFSDWMAQSLATNKASFNKIKMYMFWIKLPFIKYYNSFNILVQYFVIVQIIVYFEFW